MDPGDDIPARQRSDGGWEKKQELFVQNDEKTLYFSRNPLAFCALLLYNNAKWL